MVGQFLLWQIWVGMAILRLLGSPIYQGTNVYHPRTPPCGQITMAAHKIPVDANHITIFDATGSPFNRMYITIFYSAM